MAASPFWKVYNPQGEYVASCVHAEDAATLVACYGNGAEIRGGHARKFLVWSEGNETFPAGESYDRVALLCAERIKRIVLAARPPAAS